MSLNLYDLSVPVFIRALGQLKEVLQIAEKWAKDNNVDEKKLTEGKIIDDMLVSLQSTQRNSTTTPTH